MVAIFDVRLSHSHRIVQQIMEDLSNWEMEKKVILIVSVGFMYGHTLYGNDKVN